MPFLPSFPENHHLSDVFKTHQQGILPLLQYHDDILRGPGPLTIAQRELIAAITSGTNACSFCYGAHSVAAERFGIEEKLMDPRYLQYDVAMEYLDKHIAVGASPELTARLRDTRKKLSDHFAP